MNDLEEMFREYLVNKGYSVETPNGLPSTVYDYCKRISRVCKDEGLTWLSLAKQINSYINEYDIGGLKEDKGSKSHRAVINELKAYKEFLSTINNCA